MIFLAEKLQVLKVCLPPDKALSRRLLVTLTQLWEKVAELPAISGLVFPVSVVGQQEKLVFRNARSHWSSLRQAHSLSHRSRCTKKFHLKLLTVKFYPNGLSNERVFSQIVSMSKTLLM